MSGGLGRITMGKSYQVIGIEADAYRILNDDSDPCLYEPGNFEVVDPHEPKFWESELGSDGERYAYPAAWNSPGFFENFHDKEPTVVAQFWRDHERLFGNV